MLSSKPFSKKRPSQQIQDLVEDKEPQYPNDENLIIATITATIAEIRDGKPITLTYFRSFRCESCAGKKDDCPDCRGKGYFSKIHHMDAILKECPKGVLGWTNQ
jgi:DnaJ-class molecular chaperone